MVVEELEAGDGCEFSADCEFAGGWQAVEEDQFHRWSLFRWWSASAEMKTRSWEELLMGTIQMPAG